MFLTALNAKISIHSHLKVVSMTGISWSMPAQSSTTQIEKPNEISDKRLTRSPLRGKKLSPPSPLNRPYKLRPMSRENISNRWEKTISRNIVSKKIECKPYNNTGFFFFLSDQRDSE